MTTKEPAEIAQAAVATGVKKAHLRWDKVLVGGFLAGAYIAFGGLLAVAVSSGLDPKTWGSVPTLITGSVFTLGLVLVLVAGSHLATGNMLLVPIGAMQRRLNWREVVGNLTLVLIGNLAGALFVAYFLAVQSGVIGHVGAESGTSGAMTYQRLAGIASLKALHENEWQIFLRAVGCNWLVCLAVWISLAAENVADKVLGIFFPIMGFVAMGFDHVVANMFFLPAAIFAGMPGLGWGDVLHNWVFAFLGNLVGAVVFVATSYWYMYLRDEPSKERPREYT
ncbi:formate/nitrite transporter family protein [Planosporangium flavigriseum]|uniref:Putative transporter YrhG n=1 Tax=Planosporangium flavigriseum TaxID=373681 RepID=A0A8J3LR63_9ACTN|nr:formate/nitrite transporter family protein [Planosporangium flavigriseum]NJC63420.1 formate/nitrite transporter family protein [Planosporangium flavigriseum]GIG76522.1 putative transporter YrhG [Planosporangium flavigriseum]